MIHEEKWYTCDRCGERIENLVEDVLGCLPEEVSVKITRDDYLKIMSGESDVSIVNAEFDGKDTETATIRKVFLTKEDTIHLCGKCKREFERFMKNDKEVMQSVHKEENKKSNADSIVHNDV